MKNTNFKHVINDLKKAGYIVVSDNIIKTELDKNGIVIFSEVNGFYATYNEDDEISLYGNRQRQSILLIDDTVINWVNTVQKIIKKYGYNLN